jgi:hypothetical protein
MKLVLKSWTCGAISPNTPHTFRAWCFITKRIDFTVPHNISHFLKENVTIIYTQNPHQMWHLNIYISAMNENFVHIGEMARSYMPPIREQSHDWLKHYKTFTGTQKLLTGNCRSRLSMTRALSFVHVTTRWCIWQNYQLRSKRTPKNINHVYWWTI